jgi:hypothetical protein
MVKKGGGIDDQIGFQPLWEQLVGHIILVNALAGGLGHAGEAADTVLDILLAQVYHLDLGAGLTHSFDQMVHHHFGSALAPFA